MVGMDPEDVAGQRLVPGGHAADEPGSEHAVAARRDEPAIQRFGENPAYRPDPKRPLYSSTYATINAVSGRAVPRKSRRRRQYLVHPPQSRDLGPQTLQLRHRVLSRLLGLRRDRGVRLVAPTAQRLQPPDPGNPFDRLELRRVSRTLCHGSIISHRVREMWNNNQFISDRGHRHGEIQVHRALSFLGTGQYDNPFIQSPRKRPQSLIDAK